MVNYNESFPVGTIYTSSDDSLTRWFVYTSGEHIELAKTEVSSLVELVSANSKIHWQGRFGIIECTSNVSEFILNRSALTQKAGVVLYDTESSERLIDTDTDTLWNQILSINDTFSVKTLCIDIKINLDKRLHFERELGAYIKKTTNAKVDLKNATVQILVIFTESKIFVCKSNDSKLRINLRKREPSKKSFFHPSMMNSSLARVMCNLAQIQEGDIVLDPFCGGGGILCEASYLGASVVGMDVNWGLLNGAKRNLEDISRDYSILQADIKQMPINSVDCIVTDPPYGRSSSTRGDQSIKLVEELLKKIESITKSTGEHICLCGSTEMNLPRLIQDYGFHIGKDVKLRVHSGLVREIVTIIL